MTFKPTPMGTNLKTKKNEEIKNPKLTKLNKGKRGTGYAVWGTGTGGITLFRIMGKDKFDSYKSQGMPEQTYKKK